MLINLTYEQIHTLLVLVCDNEEDSDYSGLRDLNSALTSVIQEAWNPGTVLSPMMIVFKIHSTSNTLEGCFNAKRTELANSYSPTSMLLNVEVANGIWEQRTLNTKEFTWRHL